MRVWSLCERQWILRVETFRRETIYWTATPMHDQLCMMRRVAFLEWILL